MGHNGGCHADEGDPLPSPVHALGVVLEQDGELSVELVLVTTSTDAPMHVNGARATFSVEDQEVELHEGGPGRYRTTATPAAAFGSAMQLTLDFTIDDAAARAHRVHAGAFSLLLHGALDVPVVWMEDSDTVAWSPGGAAAFIEVVDADGVRTFASLDWADPDIAASTWRTLPHGGEQILPPVAFSGPAPHVVRVCAVETFRRDAPSTPQHLVDGDGPAVGLGWLSGGIAGRCAIMER